MTSELQLETTTDTVIDENIESLQAIITTQSTSINYQEASDISNELLAFFEALGEENEPDEGSNA